MRSTQTCPKCSGKRFAVSAEFRQPDVDSGNRTLAFSAITVVVASRAGHRITLGRLEAWICVGCGYTELYAHGLDGIETIAKQYPDQLRIVDATPPEQGPYR